MIIWKYYLIQNMLFNQSYELQQGPHETELELQTFI
jgi:hypothetical protein